MKLSAAIALGAERLIKERLPARIMPDGRVLPTGAAAVQLLGPPPRGPPLMRRRPNQGKACFTPVVSGFSPPRGRFVDTTETD